MAGNYVVFSVLTKFSGSWLPDPPSPGQTPSLNRHSAGQTAQYANDYISVLGFRIPRYISWCVSYNKLKLPFLSWTVFLLSVEQNWRAEEGTLPFRDGSTFSTSSQAYKPYVRGRGVYVQCTLFKITENVDRRSIVQRRYNRWPNSTTCTVNLATP